MWQNYAENVHWKLVPDPFLILVTIPKQKLFQETLLKTYFERRLSKILKNLTLFFLFHPLHFYAPISCWGKQIFKKPCHRFNAFSRNVNTIYWTTFSTDSGIYKLEKIQQAFWREFVEIWKDLSMRLIFKDKGGKQPFLSLCWL